jgi:hypothetical protein
MDSLPPPFVFVVLLFTGWVNRQQQAVIDYLLEETVAEASGPDGAVPLSWRPEQKSG